MTKINVGDLIKHLLFQNETFIVTDVEDHSVKKDGSKLLYQVMELYPVKKISRVRFFKDDKYIDSVGKKGDTNYSIVMTLVNLERKKLGLYDKPEYEKLVALRTNKKKIEEPLDIVNYSKLYSVDECLDALNDLKELHKHFGDEAYLQLREVVMKRLKEFV